MHSLYIQDKVRILYLFILHLACKTLLPKTTASHGYNIIPGLHSFTPACKMSAVSYSDAGNRPPLSRDGHHPHPLFRYNGAILPALDRCPQLLQPHQPLFITSQEGLFPAKRGFILLFGWLVFVLLLCERKLSSGSLP